MPRRVDPTAPASLDKLVAGLAAAEQSMNVTALYQDTQAHRWAGGIFQKIEAKLGAQAVRGTWWNLNDLNQPGVLAGAVSTAIRADIIIIAVSASEGLPLPFYFWVNSWLPHRLIGAGALIGLLGEPIYQTPESGRLRKYLRTVARRTRMNLLLAEAAPTTSPREPLRLEF